MESEVGEAFNPHPEIAERFRELHPPFAPQSAVIEANRCLNCFDAPCTTACPTHIDVPRFIKKIASGNLPGSARTIFEANILGASCSRVCPVEVLCEGSCVLHRHGEKPIQIGRLQRHAMDHFYRSGARLLRSVPVERRERIACIGAGPASLACAAELRLRGFQVTVIDRRVLPGGLNTHGVAEYKLSSADSLREVELVRSLGVSFAAGEIATAADLRRLESDYDRLFLGVGLGAMRRLGIAGDAHEAVVDALRFISSYKTAGRSSAGRSVVVVGAGNTAVDAAVAAKRLGAEEVHILYRRGESHISAFSFEYEHARQEGVLFHWWSQPVALRFKGPALEGIDCVRVAPAADGSFAPVLASEFTIACDLVIPAIGQSPLLEVLTLCGSVTLEQGRVVIDRATGQTANPKYYAGGDCVNGGREVVDAVADGKRAAVGIAGALDREAARA